MKGSDVAMLEAILWQLGISPQKGSPGNEGARIGSNRGGASGLTQDCGGNATTSRLYSSGWKSCNNGRVSMEGMVRRFQARNFNLTNLSGTTSTSHVSGVAGDKTLKRLQPIWHHYYQAYEQSALRPVFSYQDLPASLWTVFDDVTDQGGDIPYQGRPNGAPVYSVSPSYTQAMHTTITADFPAPAQGIARTGVFQSWMLQEAGEGGYMWGDNPKGYQSTPFRINEGGGDEQGSMGFNHILWKRLYGAEHTCDSIRGYTASGNENINLYHPVNSALALLTAATDAQCLYSDGLHQAYNGHYTVSYSGPTPLAYCYETTDPVNMTASARCSASANAGTWRLLQARQDGGYTLLGKALIAYNQGVKSAELMNSSYLDLLRDTPRRTSSGAFSPTHFGYWLSIKKNSWRMRQQLGGYLPFVSYIWRGGVDPNTGQDWCFAYGEKEWMSGVSWSDTKYDAQNKDDKGRPKKAIGRINCK